MTEKRRERWRRHRQHCNQWPCWGPDACQRCAALDAVSPLEGPTQ